MMQRPAIDDEEAPLTTNSKSAAASYSTRCVVAAICAALVCSHSIVTFARRGLAPVRRGEAPRIVMITFFPPSYTSHFRRTRRTAWPSDEEGTSIFVDNWNCYSSLHGYQLVTERVDWGSFPNGTGLSGAALDGAYNMRDSEHKNEAGLAALKKPKPWSPNWMKVPLLRRHLPLADWALWFDGDALFISLPSSLEDVIKGLPDTDVIIFATGTPTARIGEEISRGCNCLFLVRNSPGGWWFINRWWALRARSQQWVDQGAWQSAIVEILLRQRAAKIDKDDTKWPASLRVHKDAWLDSKFDHIESPCIVPHFALTEIDPLNNCIPRELGTHFKVQLRADTAYGAVGFSFLLGDSLANKGTRLTPQQAHKHVRDRNSPPILMHTKLGKHNAFSEVYRRSAMGELVRRCRPSLRCVDPKTFALHALASELAPAAGNVTGRMTRADPDGEWIRSSGHTCAR
ncbi:hypothetical protein T492DRAFT_1019527 [Pavlovales sp. CCMP2436]|nr:hypothetical protein T492DRAFT_1019527 [Pavlovales sp. CCMP2436]